MASTAATAQAPKDDAASQQLQGIDIAKVLRSEGPIVTCVVLRAAIKSDDSGDSKPSADNNTEAFVEELQIDTTPKKNSVEKVLGGPFTFIGQYEEEGIMLMARRGWIYGEDEKEDEPKEERVLNPHKLQPPFNKIRVYGDILVLKVAEMEDPLDEDDEADTSAATTTTAKAAVEVTSNDEFFLDYTKESYLSFAARTDVVPPEAPPADEEEDAGEAEQNDDEEEDAGEWSGEDDDDDEEDEEGAQEAMMQLILSSVLKGFQAKEGRDPTEEELAVLKLTVAQKLGMMLPGMEGDDEEEEEDEDEEEADGSSEEEAASPAVSEESAKENAEKKRSGDDTLGVDEPAKPNAKKIKFDADASDEKQEPAVAAQ